MYRCSIVDMNGQARTNDFAEAVHKSLQGLLNVHHPSLLKFIEGLRSCQKNKDDELERYIAGNVMPRKRNKYTY